MSSFVINEKGEKTAIILSIEEYNRLMEDLHDLTIFAERKDEDEMPHDDVENMIQDDL